MNALQELSRRAQPDITFVSPPVIFVGDGGAGKTTTAVSAVKHAIRDYRFDPDDVVVIANDTYNAAFGGEQFIIDQELFPPGVRVIRIVQCGCCESIDDLENEIRQAFSDKPFKMLVVEAVPGAEPVPLINAFVDRFNVRPNVVGVVNADEALPDIAFREHVIEAADVLLVTRADKAPGLLEIRNVISVLRSPANQQEQLKMVESSQPNDLQASFFNSLAIPSTRDLSRTPAARHDMREQFGLTVLLNPDLVIWVDTGNGANTTVYNQGTRDMKRLVEILSPHRRVKGFVKAVGGDHYYVDYTNDLSGGNLKVQKIDQPLSIHGDSPFLRFYSRGTPVEASACVAIGMPFLDVKLLGKYRYPEQSKCLQVYKEVATSWRADSLYVQGQPFVATAERSSKGQFVQFKQDWTTVLDAWLKFRLDGVKSMVNLDPSLDLPWSPRAAVELGMDLVTAAVWYGNKLSQGDAWYASLLLRMPLAEYGELLSKGKDAGGLGVARLLFSGFAKLDALPKILRDKTYEKKHPNAESFGSNDPDMFFMASAVVMAKKQGMSREEFSKAVANVARLLTDIGNTFAAKRWAELLVAGQAMYGGK